MLTYSHFAFAPSLLPEISSASLVISHAGAGTCLDVLGLGKPHVVVVNEELMNNHQIELAEKLSEEGHLKHCVCDTLAQTLAEFDTGSLKPYPEGTQGLLTT